MATRKRQMTMSEWNRLTHLPYTHRVMVQNPESSQAHEWESYKSLPAAESVAAQLRLAAEPGTQITVEPIA